MASNNLRDKTGALIGGLVVYDYTQGMTDFYEGVPPPENTSPSYDLGRQRAAEKSAEKAQFENWLKRQEEETDRRIRMLLTQEQYAEYRAQIDRMRG